MKNFLYFYQNNLHSIQIKLFAKVWRINRTKYVFKGNFRTKMQFFETFETSR